MFIVLISRKKLTWIIVVDKINKEEKADMLGRFLSGNCVVEKEIWDDFRAVPFNSPPDV